jgi:Domain of unknown function (DU1801)
MPSKAPKTKPTEVAVDDFLARVTPDVRRDDARALCAIMARASGEAPRMWGPSIIGFGQSSYTTADGQEHLMLAAGFSPRKAALVLYVSYPEKDPLAARLGKFTHGKSCIYVKRLADIDQGVLEAMVKRAMAAKAW